MQTARHLLLAHRRWATLLVAMVLALRLVVPAGYMISSGPAGMAVTICPGVIAPMAGMAGMHHSAGKHGGTREHGQPDKPCAFSGLVAPALAGPGPVLLALAFAVVAAAALQLVPSVPDRLSFYLRPPLRGPPPTLI